MTPFVIEHADAYDLLAALPDDAVDVTITDPPYDAHCQANQSSGTMMREVLTGERKGGIPRIELPFAALESFAFVGELLRVTRRWVLVFCTVESFGGIRRAFPKEYVRGAIWYKANAMGQLTADRPATAYEGIAILHKAQPKKRWNGKGSFGIWRCNGTRGKKGRHPSEKPLALCQKLVALFSDRGETVLDPFCGSAAIGEASLSLGRGYVGCDSDDAWYAAASGRLANIIDPIDDLQALSLCRMATTAEMKAEGEST